MNSIIRVSDSPPALVEKLRNESSTVAITSAFIHAHHENCRPGPVAYPETAYQLVVDILKIDKTWPYSRTSRLSRNLSLHNCLVAQTTLEFLYETSKGQTEFFYAPWIKQLAHFVSQSVGETEHLVAACEIIAGSIRASSCWDTQAQQQLWQLLCPCLVTACQKLDQDLFADLLDAIRYGVDTIPEDRQMQGFIPIVNLVLDMNSVPDVVSFATVLMSMCLAPVIYVYVWLPTS